MHAALLKLQTKAELVTQRCQNSNPIPCRFDSARFESTKSREIEPTCSILNCTLGQLRTVAVHRLASKLNAATPAIATPQALRR
jgi:hypothetical protein